MLQITCFEFVVGLFFLTQNEYDKMVEEKDAELRVYKIKQQKQLSSERALVRSTFQC